MKFNPKCTLYVDDIFTIFSKITANEFNQKLNNLHHDLMFTMESSTSNKLPFIGINKKIRREQI